MAITFRTVGHFFATFWQKAESLLPKIEATAPVVEGVSAVVPNVGLGLVTAERVAYAVLGEVSALLSATDVAARQKLSDVGLDVAVIAAVEALLKDAPEIVALAKTL